MWHFKVLIYRESKESCTRRGETYQSLRLGIQVKMLSLKRFLIFSLNPKFQLHTVEIWERTMDQSRSKLSLKAAEWGRKAAGGVLRQLLHWGWWEEEGGTGKVSSWLEQSGLDNTFLVSGWLYLGCTTVLIKTNEKEGKASKSSDQWRAV